MLWERADCEGLPLRFWPTSNQTQSSVKGDTKGLLIPLPVWFRGDFLRTRVGAVGISFKGVPVGNIRAETKSRFRVLPVSRSIERLSSRSGVELGASLLLLVNFCTQASSAPPPWRSLFAAFWIFRACSPLLELRAARGYGNRSGEDEVVPGSEESL